MADNEELNSYLDLAKTRRAVRSYRSTEYPDDVLRTVIEAANNAPSPAGVQPWEFVIVRDEAIKKELADAYSAETQWKNHLDPEFELAGNSREFIDSPATVCIVGDRRYKRLWPEAADDPVSYREKLFHQSLANCIVSLQLAGTTAGLGTTWPSTRAPTQHRLRNLLDLPEWYHVGSSVPLGHPDLDNAPMAKHRTDVKEKIHEDRFDTSQIPTYDDLMERKARSRQENFNPDEGNISRREQWNTETELHDFADLTAAWRTTEQYLDETVSFDVVREVLSAGIWAPSAANSQPWEFIVVRDQTIRSRVSDIVKSDREYKERADPGFRGDEIADLVNVPQEAFDSAPIHVIVVGNRHLEKLWPQVPDQSREKLFRHSMSACITSITYAARAAGLGMSWLTPTNHAQQQLRELTGLFDVPGWYYVESVTPLGYPDPDHDPKRRDSTPVEEKIHWNALDHSQVPDTEDITRD